MSDNEQALAVDKFAMIREMQAIQVWWHINGNDGAVDPDHMVDGLIGSGILQDVAEVERKVAEWAWDEGHDCGFDDARLGRGILGTANPYRAESEARND